MDIIIIGGTGFVGSHVVRLLVHRGHQVTIFHRGSTQADLPENVQQIIGDRRDLSSFRETFRQVGPQVVVDTIPMTKQDADEVMWTFDGIAERVIALSSVDVYRAFFVANGKVSGPPEPVPISEDGRLREDLYPYRGVFDGMDDYEKILVERAVLGHSRLPGTILRLAMVYGPADVRHRVHPYLKRMDDGRSAILLASHLARWRSPRVYVENVAEGVAVAVEKPMASGRIYNVSDHETLTEAEWVARIGSAAGWQGEIVIAPPDALPEDLRMDWLNTDQQAIIDTSRIRDELGYTDAVDIDEGLRRTIAWERDHRLEGLPDARGWETRQQFDYVGEDVALARLSGLR